MDDISFLVSETFKNVENTSNDHAHIPSGGGVLYSLAENDSTYVIRGVSSKNLKNDIDNLFTTSLHEKLRVEQGGESQVFWFETPFWELSELILETATQKRFLKAGETLSNLSDPLLSWTISDDGESLFLDCTGRKSHRANHKKLGYLGESSIASARFSQLLGRELKSPQIEIAEEKYPELYAKMKSFFYYSSYDSEWFERYFQKHYSVNIAEALSLYFQEIAMMMSFLEQVSTQINQIKK